MPSVLLHAALATALAQPGPHAEHQQMFGDGAPVPASLPARGPLPPPTPGPDVTVYGYLPYWDNNLSTVPWDELSHLALFSADVTPTGTLTQTQRWNQAAEALAMAEPYGVRVHLCITNFTTEELETLLGSATYRSNLIAELQGWVQSTGVHGINVDFERMPANRRQQMVDFIADLQDAVGEVVIATPAVDWSNAWDYGALTDYADLFIMGYGYHWSGSSNAGPTDPLYSGTGTVWPAQHSLVWSVEDHIAQGADPARVILGLPLYGLRYPVANNQVPTANTGSGSSVFMRDGVAEAQIHGAEFEAGSRSWWTYTGSEQVWYPEVDSVAERVRYAVEAQIGGVGFWALNYEGNEPALWEAVRQETTSEAVGDDDDDETPAGPSGFTADAGPPFLAYVGDTIYLSGAGSRGPAGVELQYRWEQVGGPRVVLTGDDQVEPHFLVEGPGTHTFELSVGDGESWSIPARSYVVVLDPDAGRRHHTARGCGCATPAPTGLMPWLALPLLIRIRRRR